MLQLLLDLEMVGAGFGSRRFDHYHIDFSLTVNVATLIFISGCGSAISSPKEGKSGFIYNMVKS